MTTISNVPPGLGDVEGRVFAQGGCEQEWWPFERRRVYTNAFVIDGDKVLLGYKKRGFGAGLYNGFGGKVEEGETPLQAAIRELQEEAGIDAPLTYAGTLFFVVKGTDCAFDIRIYSATAYHGEPIETDEMRPGWFSLSDDSLYARSTTGDADAAGSDHAGGPGDLPHIPYNKMWADDVHWLPHLVRGEKFVGRADFEEGNIMKRYWFGTIMEDGDQVQ